MIMLKSDSDLAGLRAAGRLAADILRSVSRAVVPGVTTRELGQVAERLMHEAGARSAFLGYRGFPGVICVSVNDEIVHGIPGNRKVAAGDVVSIDVGVRYQGYVGDTATTVMVEVVDPDVIRVVETARRALDAGLEVCREGERLGAVSNAIEQTTLAGGCAVVRDFVGHGIGRELHEEPQVPNYGRPGSGPKLRRGMTLCIEPMVNQFAPGIKVLPDGWTAVTRDGGVSAHFEHMVAVNNGSVEVLSLAT